LVVVAIIGLLSAVVSVLLTGARKKGDDAAVQSNLRTIANQAELFSLNNGNSYLPPGVKENYYAKCPDNDSSGTSIFSVDKTIAASLTEAIKRSDTNFASSCFNSTNVWAVAMPLKTTSGTYWCADSTGAARMIVDPNSDLKVSLLTAKPLPVYEPPVRIWEPLTLAEDGVNYVCNN
ncbi:MAG: type II secretion system protein, partial [Candidatus Paceibacterota bacterium]|jgi:type II secretory pathway pseudopilin PulG